MVAELIFIVEGNSEDLEWLRTRIDGAIDEIIYDAKEGGQVSQRTDYGWELKD